MMGRGILGVVTDKWGDPRGGSVRIGGHSRMSGPGEGTLGEVWNGLGTLGEVQDETRDPPVGRYGSRDPPGGP